LYSSYLDGYITEEEYEYISDIISTFKIRREFRLEYTLNPEDTNILNSKLNYIEFALIKNWRNINNLEFSKLCSLYIDIAKLIPFPDDEVKRINYLVKFISYGYLAESWESVRRFLIGNEDEFIIDIEDDQWSLRLLKTIYMALFYMLKKESWTDLEKTIGLINKLRGEQERYEKEYLESVDNFNKKSASYELAALYHLAKIVEYIGEYQLNGSPENVESILNEHFDQSISFSEIGAKIELNLVVRSLLPAALKMINNSIWSLAQTSFKSDAFYEKLIKAKRPVIEFMYPQRFSLIEKDLLHPASKAIVINLPTSSGKTLISEFKMLQALNQFSEEKGWIAYVAPTRALVNQVTIELRKDLGVHPLNIKVEQISGALEIDVYEENIMTTAYDFDILVTTPEKLSLLIRQDIESTIGRKLALVVIDEAQNISSDTRGINLETLLSMIKNDCADANYLLMSPFIPNSKEIAYWLDNENPKNISLDFHFWRPNDMIVGVHYGDGRRPHYKLNFLPLMINSNFIEKEIITIPLDRATKKDELTTKYKISALLASQLEHKGNIMIISGTKPTTFRTAEYLYSKLDLIPVDNEINLVRRYIAQELGREFPLVKYLTKGIGIHHAGLPDDIRFLIEDLMGKGKIKYLISTTTTAQGINFPVSTIIISDYSLPNKSHMPIRDFWNFAGRVGRVYSDSPGIVSLAIREGINSDDGIRTMNFLNLETKSLVSNLVAMVENALNKFSEINLEVLYNIPEWSSFLQYLSHMFKQTESLEDYIRQVESTLQKTYGYQQLNEEYQRILRSSVIVYAEKLTHELANISDSTGFSSYTIRSITPQIHDVKMTSSDLFSDKMFEPNSEYLRVLVGIMLDTPEISRSLKEIKIRGSVIQHNTLSRLITAWVRGKDIPTISQDIYGNSHFNTIAKCVNHIYGKLILSASWGLSSFQKIISEAIDFTDINELDLIRLRNIPAMIYYGVDTDEAILLRKTSVPRSIAPNLGKLLRDSFGDGILYKTPSFVTDWLYDLDEDVWNMAAPDPTLFSGTEHKQIWKLLNGI